VGKRFALKPNLGKYSHMETLKVYTDGACSGNPGPGGYASIIIDSKGKEISLSGGENPTTNNRMEMMALIKALEYLHKNYNARAIQVELYVDSQYVLNGSTQWLAGWKKKNWKSTSGLVKNRDLWEQIDSLIQGLNLKWTWVKGHNEDKYNEMADVLAVSEVEKFR
jgi:ribonuclease HI